MELLENVLIGGNFSPALTLPTHHFISVPFTQGKTKTLISCKNTLLNVCMNSTFTS